MAGFDDDDSPDLLYTVLGVDRTAKDVEIRRAYRNLITREHPDKGGDPVKFSKIQEAYEVLSSEVKRRQYDETGRVEKTVDEEFMEGFSGGKFRNRREDRREDLSSQIATRQSENSSHSAGFDAWMRARGENVKVFTVDDAAEQFGVVRSSYEGIPLPKIKAFQVVAQDLGHPKEKLELVSEPIPPELEWGEILISIRAASINPADLYNVKAGTMGMNIEQLAPPFVAGNDGVGMVVKVGPGVKSVLENDWVIPFKPGLGTWRSLAVWKERDILKLPTDSMPIEYAALLREMCVAYRLLEDFGEIKPGDGVILNAGNSTVGQCVIQLCRLLKLRCYAVIRSEVYSEKNVAWLKTLGAEDVFEDAYGLKQKLEENKIFVKPKLALDCIGDSSAVRLSETLGEGGTLAIYGCMSGKSPQWPWHSWVFKELRVCGFNQRKWFTDNKKKIPAMITSLAKLVANDRLRINYTEYELATEFEEALDHALETGKCTKVLLKVNDIGVTYE